MRINLVVSFVLFLCSSLSPCSSLSLCYSLSFHYLYWSLSLFLSVLSSLFLSFSLSIFFYLSIPLSHSILYLSLYSSIYIYMKKIYIKCNIISIYYLSFIIFPIYCIARLRLWRTRRTFINLVEEFRPYLSLLGTLMLSMSMRG